MFTTSSAAHTPYSFKYGNSTTQVRSNPTPVATSGDSFVADHSFQLGLIPANLGIGQNPQSTPPATYRLTSPLVVQGQLLAGQVASQAVPGLSALAPNTDTKEILSLFDSWNGALKTGNPDKVVEQYAPDAILLPTVSNKVRHNHAEIKDYFEHFLAKGPNGKIDESNIRSFGDIAINSGVYTFDFANGDKVQARFTFVYRKIDGEWKIAEHHSSAMPEKTPH